MQNLINLFKLRIVFVVVCLTFITTSYAASGTWKSFVTGEDIIYTVTEASTPTKDALNRFVTVVYLENLGFDKIGGNSNSEDVNWLLSQGYRVVELDYAQHDSAKSPNINADIIAINDSISSGSFCGLNDCSNYQSYVLFEGYRIKRNVAYFVDNPSVYGYGYLKDSLYMDIVYPENPIEEVPVVLSFSYSNSYQGNPHSRLFLGYTLSMFDDSFLEGAPASGMAWAIADHPKYAPWGYGDAKSFEVNPDAAQKVKSAVRTLRAMKDDIGLSGKIGIYGFSRGSDAGSMAVGDKAVEAIDTIGFNISVSDNIQAAALGSGVFDFTQIFNTEEDDINNLREKCPALWGPLESNYDKWYSMGAAYFVETSASAPVLFFYNADDANYYQDQIAHFKEKLDTTGVSTSTLVNYGEGHAVPKTSESLKVLYDFFNEKFALATDITESMQSATGDLSLVVYPNPAVDELRFVFTLAKADEVKVVLYNQIGMAVYQSNMMYSQQKVNEKINLNELNLPQGVYYLSVSANGSYETKKFIKLNK